MISFLLKRDEDKADRAIREVREEVGYDISPLLVAQLVYVAPIR